MPDWKRVIQDRLGPLGLSPAAETDFIEELAQHLEDRYSELQAGGATEEEAYERITAELNDMEAIRRASKKIGQTGPNAAPLGLSHNSPGFFRDLQRDLRYAGRTARKNPWFVLFVVLTLGLGIGANTTVFTIVNTLILNPLPIPNSAELAAIAASESKSAQRQTPLPVSYADLKDFQDGNQAFRAIAGYTSPRVITLQRGSASERMFCELATGNYFDALGLRPAAGRFFARDEDSTPGGHPVAVLNFATWQARFGGSQAVIGRTLRINNVELTVIGVAPPKFIGVNAIFGPDLWIPAAMAERLLPNEMRDVLTDRSKAAFAGVGRLKPGVKRAQAQANIETIAAALAREYPETNQGHTIMVRPITDVMFASASLGSSPVLLGSLVLLIVVGIVLLIACSNVANLLLARATARQHEIAVRLALGASRIRVLRQFLTENIFLGCLSGLVGILIGYAGLQLLWSSLPAETAANLTRPKLDQLVLAFAMLVSLGTGFVFGTIPALRASRVSLAETLKEEARAIGRSRTRITFGNVLLVGQVALSFLLLVTAGLFLRSIGRAYQMDPGFQTDHLAIFLTNPGQAGYGKAQTKAFYKEVRGRVAALPGIASVSWASNLPLWAGLASGLQVEGYNERSQADTITTVVNIVDLGYFGTAGIAIEQGREFSEIDREGSAPVAIVNEKLAHDYWPSENPLGKRIRLPSGRAMREVVGVARTANYSNLAEPPQLCVYIPLEQSFSDSMTLYVKTKGDPGQSLIPVQREVRVAGPGILANDIRAGRTIIDQALFQAKMGVALLSAFGLLALALASVGLYGIIAYGVSRRTREIGVRMALGAAQGNVLRLVLRQGMTLVAAGMLIGLGAALAAGRLLARILYGVSATDPMSIAGAALVLFVVALAACYLPARSASRLDPLAALRES
jgi:predicted permease